MSPMIPSPFDAPAVVDQGESPQLKDLCTLRWAAKRLELSERTVRRYIHSGTLKKFWPKHADEGTAFLLSVPAVNRLRAARAAAGIGPR